MRKQPLFLFVLLFTSPLMADEATSKTPANTTAPEALIKRLQELDEGSPLTVEVGLGKNDAEAPTIVKVTDAPTGLSIEWQAELIERFAEGSNREGAKGRRNDLLDRAKPSALYDYLHAADKVLQHLAKAEFLGEKPLADRDLSRRELAFKLDPGLDGEAKKYVKEISLELKLVTTDDYTPVRATVTSHVRGRAMMVISFGEDATETFEFSVLAGRLVTTLHTRESKASGTGGDREDKTRATVKRL